MGVEADWSEERLAERVEDDQQVRCRKCGSADVSALPSAPRTVSLACRNCGNTNGIARVECPTADEFKTVGMFARNYGVLSAVWYRVHYALTNRVASST